MWSSIVAVLKINSQRKSPYILEIHIEIFKEEMVLCLVFVCFLKNSLCVGAKGVEVKTNLATC